MNPYDMQFIEKSMEQIIDLSKYGNPDLEIDEEITNYKDKELFEKTILKLFELHITFLF